MTEDITEKVTWMKKYSRRCSTSLAVTGIIITPSKSINLIPRNFEYAILHSKGVAAVNKFLGILQ